tara:strand:- start:160 stop:714 length:555 start_codon:yes stop_codon:yes gene_type:complete
MSNSQDEFSDPIEKFIKNPYQQAQQQQMANSQLQAQQQQMANSQQQYQEMVNSQLQAQQQQQIANSQQQYQEMIKREMMQNHLNIQNNQNIHNSQNLINQENLTDIKETFLSKLRTFTTTATLKEILVIGILFIVFTNTLFKNIIGNTIPFINIDSDGNFNTIGLLFISLLFGIIFVLIKLFII